jgi:hypothetical protein
MSQQQQSKIADEMGRMRHEPLLPIEKKLITWSLAVGLVLLLVLALIRRMLV